MSTVDRYQITTNDKEAWIVCIIPLKCRNLHSTIYDIRHDSCTLCCSIHVTILSISDAFCTRYLRVITCHSIMSDVNTYLSSTWLWHKMPVLLAYRMVCRYNLLWLRWPLTFQTCIWFMSTINIRRSSIWITIIKISLSSDRYIFILGIHILVTWHPFFNRSPASNSFIRNEVKFTIWLSTLIAHRW